MPLDKIKKNFLNKYAYNLRLKTLEKFFEMGEAHLGGSFSMIEILISIYEFMMSKSDIFILSKSHASVPLCLLLRDKGYKTKITTHLEIDRKNGINCTTGSLGHGLPIATGMALSNHIKKNNKKTFVLISDGECQEGTTWESLLIASKYNLKNMFILIDYNKIQALDFINNGLPLHNLKKKFESFNCHTIEIKNGHSFNEIFKKFNHLLKNKINKPKIIIFNTIKGKGVKSFENDPIWHAKKVRSKEFLIAKKELK